MIGSPHRFALVACALGCASCGSTVDAPSTDHHATASTGSSSTGSATTGAGGASGTDTTASGTTSGVGSGGAIPDAAGTGTGGAPDGGGGGGPDLFDAGLDAPLGPPPDFGPNVLIFDPSMPMATIQSQIDAVIGRQASSQFGTNRYAYFFKPGSYTLDVKVGFYMQVLGLGVSPDEVVITGAVRSKADWFGGNATLNFWRAAENLAVVPTQDANTDIWAVSQGTSLRRMHVKGPLTFSDGGYSSGGFIADSLVDGRVSSGSQQQFFSRNTDWASWAGGVWNMVFVGAGHAPAGAWPGSPFTVVDRTPLVREKPYLVVDKGGHYFVVVPPLVKDTQGPSWSAAPGGYAVSTDQFYIARPMTDTATTINAALAQGRNLLFTPGIYHLDASLSVTRADTIVMGLGLTTLVPNGAIPAMVIADVDGVKVSGLMFDAGAAESPTLLQVGEAGASRAHSADPTSLHDVFCRVGGGTAGVATSCLTINSNDVVADNLWLWRADHGAGAGWTSNRSKNGLIVNGSGVTVYGLFVEHFQEYQTLWNGNGGRVFFYQSEMPYDPPSQSGWTHDGVNGFSTYKVAPSVTTHEVWGAGMYSAFRNAVVLDNAMETPTAAGVSLHHLITVWLNGSSASAITHIVNGTGASATPSTHEARSAN